MKLIHLYQSIAGAKAVPHLTSLLLNDGSLEHLMHLPKQSVEHGPLAIHFKVDNKMATLHIVEKSNPMEIFRLHTHLYSWTVEIQAEGHILKGGYTWRDPDNPKNTLTLDGLEISEEEAFGFIQYYLLERLRKHMTRRQRLGLLFVRIGYRLMD